MSTTIWFTGLSGSGKSTIAEKLEQELATKGKRVCIIDGDDVRGTLHAHLGFSKEDITENNRLIAELVRERSSEYEVILVPIISPFADSRASARKAIGDGFIELHVHASEDIRVARDPKGLYQKAKEGAITNLIGYGGVDYEPPKKPDIVADTGTEPLDDIVKKLLRVLDV